jgi:beta-phosphoglucomutase
VTRITTVLFDLDGVLVDATEWHYVALNRALALFGFDITRYEHLSDYNGLPTRKKLHMLSVAKGLPVALHRTLSRLKQVYTRDEILTKCRPVFEKEYMLSRLRAEGYRLAVCSNSIRESLAMMVHQSGLDEYFEFLVSNEDVSRPKPDPEIYLTAMARLGVAPAETLIVEDSPHGLEAARRSGAHLCQVSGFPDVDYFKIRGAIDRVERRPSSERRDPGTAVAA